MNKKFIFFGFDDLSRLVYKYNHPIYTTRMFAKRFRNFGSKYYIRRSLQGIRHPSTPSPKCTIKTFSKRNAKAATSPLAVLPTTFHILTDNNIDFVAQSRNNNDDTDGKIGYRIVGIFSMWGVDGSSESIAMTDVRKQFCNRIDLNDFLSDTNAAI